MSTGPSPASMPGAPRPEQRHLQPVTAAITTDEARALLDLIAELQDRLAVLEARQPRAKDDLNERIVAFLTRTGLRMTALVVAENIGEDNGRVGNRLTTLANHGTIGSSKQPGRHRIYYAEPGSAERAAAQAEAAR